MNCLESCGARAAMCPEHPKAANETIGRQVIRNHKLLINK